MGAPLGNRNAAKAKRWSAAIDAALERFEGRNSRGEAVKGLNAIADRIVELAFEGDIVAMKELGDRIEGKVVQRTELTGAEGSPFIPPSIVIGAPKS